MDNIPVTGLDELDRHLDDLMRDSSIPLNAKLIDEVELQLTESNTPPLVVRFLPRLTTVLKQYPEDPTILANLAVKLLRPVSFPQVLSLASEESLIQALDAPAPSANLLAMTVLHKAAASPAEASILSAMPALLAALLRRWLASPFVEVGQLGGKVLIDLLETDCDVPPPTATPTSSSTDVVLRRRQPGHGKLWQRLFAHEPTYTLLLDLCAGRHPDTHDAHQLSLAQGRLLRVLPRIAALNLRAVARSEFTPPPPGAVPMSNGDGGYHAVAPRPGDGLLQFAGLGMVDRNDRLLHLSLVEFFKGLVVVMRTEASAFKVETVRALLLEAMAGDELLREELARLPEEMVEEEVEGMRAWLRELVPGQVLEVPMR